MVRKYYVTDFYNDILQEIGEGNYWFAVEERVRKEYPNPERILEFLTAEHLPLGYDAANQNLFTRAALCDFAPLFPLFSSKDEAREMLGDLITFYANLHRREFFSELKKRGKHAIYKEFCLGALKLAEEMGWQEAEILFVIEDAQFEKSEVAFSGTLREIEEFILEGSAFTFLVNTYLPAERRIEATDEQTITFYPHLRTIPDTKGIALLKKIS
ncbi:MAG: hypothetical protein ACM3UZ_15525 [Acidobacteriota bacterium]